MAHEITSSDNVVLHRERAWHGLGVVVENAPTPSKALQIAGLDWDVEKWPVNAVDPRDTHETTTVRVPKQFAIMRRDTMDCFAVLSDWYTPIQNRELADFAEALGSDGQVKIESAGSIRGGRKVWFLLKGEAFDIRKEDTIFPYVLVSNAHDGSNALRVTPTTVRVVCSNTLHAVVPNDDRGGRLENAAFVSNHFGNVKAKVEAAKQALATYGRSIESTRDVLSGLAGKPVDADAVRKFFLEAYTRDFGVIPDKAKTAGETLKRKNAQNAWLAVEKRFEEELSVAGATAWNAFNAYTGWLQHRERAGKTAEARRDAMLAANLFGVESERTFKALTLALAV